MAAPPPQRAEADHDAPKKLNDWLDHLSAPDWRAFGTGLKVSTEAFSRRRRERAEQRELHRAAQAKDPQALEPAGGATAGIAPADAAPAGAATAGAATAEQPRSPAALDAATTTPHPAEASAATVRVVAEAAAGTPDTASAVDAGLAATHKPNGPRQAGATQQPATDAELAALVESARAAIHARATAAHIHPYTVLSAEAAPEVGLPGTATGPALRTRADDGNGRDVGGGDDNAVVHRDGGSGSGEAGGLGIAAVARNIATGVTNPRPTDQELRDASPFWVEDDEPLYVPPYNLPSRTPDPPENQLDRLRRVVVAGVAAVSLLLGFLGLGLFGGDTAHSAADSPFRPRAALLSPGVDSFMIWGLIFCWIVLFAVYQWHPTQRSSPRQRDLGYPTAGAALLGALWLLSARAGMAATAMWIAIALTAVLVYCLRLMNQRTARDNAERICVDAPAALFLGWMLTVLPMSVGVYLTSRGADFLLPASWWAVLVIIGATWAAASFSMSERGRIVLALGFGWGLFWIMLVRLLGPTFSTPVAIVAGLCAFIVLLATENRRYQIGHAERRAARGQRTEY